MNEIYQSLIRAVLKLLAGYLVARGFTDNTGAESLVGALLAVISVVWGMVSAAIAKDHRGIAEASAALAVTSADAVSEPAGTPVPPGERGFAARPLMLLVAGLSLLAVLLLSAGCRLGPPDGRIIGVSQSTIGISIGQSSADAVPHIKLGYERVTYNIVPTGTNIFAPAVLNSLSLDNTFSHQVIDEDFATGGATRDVKDNSPAAVGAKARATRTATPTVPAATPAK
ncbi:MAG TPA: hypothetical protein VMB21_02095 [Candidatus Limnocylindria bacterium]|jgi:hypothetical protein|nr:hypothetical protein [Candidatus Limnocylindria bacterium]